MKHNTNHNQLSSVRSRSIDKRRRIYKKYIPNSYQMILTTPAIVRGISAFAKQAAARTLYTTQITMAPIKVSYLNKVYFCQ